MIISTTNVVSERDTFLYLPSNGVSKSIRPIIENGDPNRLSDHERMPDLECRAVLGRHELVQESVTVLEVVENLETLEM
jgi:hypothetical protein